MKNHLPIAHKLIMKQTMSRKRDRVKPKQEIKTLQVAVTNVQKKILQKMKRKPNQNKTYLWHLPFLLLR